MLYRMCITIYYWHVFSLSCLKHISFSPTFQQVLVSLIIRSMPQMSGHEMSNLLYGLGKMGVHYSYLWPVMPGEVSDNLLRTVPYMQEPEFAITIWGLLGQMGCSYSILPPNIQVLVASEVIKRRDALTAQSLTAVYQGISKTGNTPWSSLPELLRGSLLYTLDKLLSSPKGDSQAPKGVGDGYITSTDSTAATIERLKLVGNVVYSLGRMHAQWIDLPSHLQANILTTLSTPLPPLSPYPSPISTSLNTPTTATTATASTAILHAVQFEPILNSINGLARLSFTWSALNDSVKTVLLRSIPTLLYHTTTLPPSSPPTQSQSATQPPLQSTSYTTTSTSIIAYKAYANKLANMVWSLGQLNLLYTDLQKSTPHSSSNSSGSTNSTNSNSMSAKSNDIYALFIECIERLLPYMTVYEYAWSLWSLARMNILYSDLPLTTQNIIITCTTQYITYTNTEELGIIVYAFGRMRAPLNDFPGSVTSAILVGIEKAASARLDQK